MREVAYTSSSLTRLRVNYHIGLPIRPTASRDAVQQHRAAPPLDSGQSPAIDATIREAKHWVWKHCATAVLQCRRGVQHLSQCCDRLEGSTCSNSAAATETCNVSVSNSSADT